jgi:alpha-galactosidase
LPNEKIAIIGAGSLQFGVGAVGSILDSETLRGVTICLHDISEEALDLTYKACDSAISTRKGDYTLEKTTNRKEALKNASFIINSIEVTPRFELLDMDFRVSQEFGNKQVTGENGGPGGLFHSLRIIPPILDICADIHNICPNAFLINYSNPMSRICLAIKRKYPSLKFVGLCHELEHFYPILSKILGIPISHLEIKAGGLNHFGVILDIKHKDTGKDAYPDIRKNGPRVLRSIENGPYLDDGYLLIAFILEKFHYIPYTCDSHYGEYIHWAWEQANIPATRKFIRDYEYILKWNFGRLKKLIERGKGAKFVQNDGERAIPIIEGILNDSNYVEPSVNIPNDGIITNLPLDLVVECPAIINKNGATGVKLGEYPKGLAALLRTQASVQDVLVEAILTKSKDMLLQALLVDPVIETYWQANHILNEMLKLQKKYLQIELE